MFSFPTSILYGLIVHQIPGDTLPSVLEPKRIQRLFEYLGASRDALDLSGNQLSLTSLPRGSSLAAKAPFWNTLLVLKLLTDVAER